MSLPPRAVKHRDVPGSRSVYHAENKGDAVAKEKLARINCKLLAGVQGRGPEKIGGDFYNFSRQELLSTSVCPVTHGVSRDRKTSVEQIWTIYWDPRLEGMGIAWKWKIL